MYQEIRYEREMKVLFDRGVELVGQGRSANPGSDPKEYLVTVDGCEYRVAHKTTRGTLKPRYTLSIAFTPEPEDNLRFIKGTDPELPVFTIYLEADKFRGYLEFNRDRVERAHWWPRLWGLNRPSGVRTITDYVGLDRGANRMLGNLSRRLAGIPTSITPINPDQRISSLVK